KQVDVLVFTGCLGPDEDDIVKTTLSEHLDKPLVLDDDTQNRIITYHKNSDLIMPENNQLQALTLLDSIPLENVTGLALGMFYQSDSHAYLLLPGPTDELVPMFNEYAKPLLIEKRLKNHHFSHHVIRLFGLTMAQAQHDLGDVFSQQDDGFIQLYPDGLEIEVHLATHHKEKKKANQQLELLKDE